MIELYIFVNPLGLESLKAEKEVMRLAEELNTKIHYRFIPIVNLKSIQSRLKANGKNHLDLQVINEEFTNRYSAALDLKAVLLQGRKIGRRFLMELQEAVQLGGRIYSQELVFEILERLNLDKEAFLAARKSDLVKIAFKQDQQMVHEMGLVHLPNAVFFNYESEEDGFIIEEPTLLNLHQYFEDIFHEHLKAYHLNPRNLNTQANKQLKLV
ncbi:MAG: DsbA family protein [Streptococcaceae bacterium]|jgi:predicted DsbA family dithiol-disulfide isomerase|nr:DsbA family protein [Streptococcaceae bacterium]